MQKLYNLDARLLCYKCFAAFMCVSFVVCVLLFFPNFVMGGSVSVAFSGQTHLFQRDHIWFDISYESTGYTSLFCLLVPSSVSTFCSGIYLYLAQVYF